MAIERVVVIDDNEASRSAVAETVADGGVEAIPLGGPLPTLEATVERVRSEGDALVSDHHLTTERYAVGFVGAEVVAAAYRQKIPGVLCTAWGDAKGDEIRRYRQWVPAVIDSANATDPDTFFVGFTKCVEEFRGNFAPSRKAWRAQICVVEQKLADPAPVVFVIVPGWHPTHVLKLPASDLPAEMRQQILNGKDKFHVMANKGTEVADELYFDWTAPVG